MLYNTVRWIIFFCIIGLVTLILNKTPVKKNRKIFKIVIIAIAVLCFTQWNIPFENYIYSFPTLEKSFNYCSTAKNAEIFGFFEEESSGLVLYESENGYSNYIAQKTTDGWKVSNVNTYEVECAKTEEEYNMLVYHVKNTSDRYVLISTDFIDEIVTVTDSEGNAFKYVEDENDFSKHTTYFHCYSGENFDYKVFIDGEEYLLK